LLVESSRFSLSLLRDRITLGGAAIGRLDNLAPTILVILGIKSPQPMDGRVLSEAMVNVHKQLLKPETQTIEATKSFSSGTWRQTLKQSRIGSTIYLDEGNGSFVPGTVR
jgi:hypothetical protein